jgi:hypothetical protein
MPSTSQAQHRFMNIIAHSPQFAKKAGVKQSVGRDFIAADKKRGKKAIGKLSARVAPTRTIAASGSMGGY